MKHAKYTIRIQVNKNANDCRALNQLAAIALQSIANQLTGDFFDGELDKGVEIEIDSLCTDDTDIVTQAEAAAATGVKVSRIHDLIRRDRITSFSWASNNPRREAVRVSLKEVLALLK